MFDDMTKAIKEDTVRYLYNITVEAAYTKKTS